MTHKQMSEPIPHLHPAAHAPIPARLSEDEMLAMIRGENDTELFAMADRTRSQVFGNMVFMRAIVEFSNHCNKHCHYCGLRAVNRKASRYRLTAEEILLAVKHAVEQGAGTIVLQSGDDFACSASFIGDLIKTIKNRHEVAVTLSLGDRLLLHYEYWLACGADRALLKLETTNPHLYEVLRPGETFAERTHRLMALKEMGYEVGSGVISGLPGDTPESILMDVLRLTEMKLDMIAVGPFVPHPDTPMGNDPSGDPNISLRTSALLRILNPGANIPATSALDALLPTGREQGLRSGCNVIMPSVTPAECRKNYFIYPGKNILPDGASDTITLARETVLKAGYELSSARGDSWRLS